MAGTKAYKADSRTVLFFPSEIPSNTTNKSNMLVNMDFSDAAQVHTDFATPEKMNYTNQNKWVSPIIGKNIYNSSVYSQNLSAATGTESPYRFENAFRVTSEMLKYVDKYKIVFFNTIRDIIDKEPEGLEDTLTSDEALKSQLGKQVLGWTTHRVAVPSLFNPYLAVNVVGSIKGIPIYNKIHDDATITYQKRIAGKKTTTTTTDGKVTEQKTESIPETTQELQLTLGNFMQPDITDCRIDTLVRLSNQLVAASSEKNNKLYFSESLGYERYKYADFMYCKDLGAISNNYMITLRKFAYPCPDNIVNSPSWRAMGPDVGRMICWLGEDNKLEDILKYNYSMSWKELNSKIQEQNSQEDDESRGIIGSFVNLTNPSYLHSVAKGYAGSGNKFFQKLTQTGLGTIMDNKGTYEGNACLGNYDNNKVYTPKDTVQDTHLYEGKLKFSQEFTLTFNYELRAYDNINPRSAFNDLLSNIQYVTYRKGTFWGGKHQINGAPGNPGGWRKANAFIDQAWDKVGGFVEGLLAGNLDWGAIWGSISNVIGSAEGVVKDIVDDADNVIHGDGVQNDSTKKAISWFKNSGMGDAFKGMIKNKLGRPAMYAFDSLLKGEPVGMWHVTIGNPRAPMLSMGNIIVTGTTVQHYGPLGIDDFPTGLKVTVQCKHGRSRDLMEIQHMYTGGDDGLSVPMVGIDKIEQYITNFSTSMTDFADLTADEQSKAAKSGIKLQIATGLLDRGNYDDVNQVWLQDMFGVSATYNDVTDGEDDSAAISSFADMN